MNNLTLQFKELDRKIRTNETKARREEIMK